MGKVVSLPPTLRHKLPPPPDHLEEPERKLWASILNDYEIETSGEMALLEEGLASHMRARRCREQIEDQGEQVRDRFGILQQHPLLVAERGARQSFVATMKLLRLDVPAPPKPGKGG